MSTTLRRSWLKVLRTAGVRSFRTTSGLGHPFVCHVGDFAGEAPFYASNTDRSALKLMTAWCSGHPRPVVYDVGANLGFIATQLAQMLQGQQPTVIAFEPVWSTFEKLKHSVQVLGLNDCVIPVCCAISDRTGFARIAFDEAQSLFAQIRPDASNPRVGRKSNWVAIETLDRAAESFASFPVLLKVDVEGFEAHVLRGARALLSRPEPPAILFEWNPLTLREVGTPLGEIAATLPGWKLFYIDDFQGQRMPFGSAVDNLEPIEWPCNVFAVPPNDRAMTRWRAISVVGTQSASTMPPP